MSTQPELSKQEQTKPVRELTRVYGVIAEWLLYPEEIDPDSLRDDSVSAALEAARAIDVEVESSLRHFGEQRATVDAEQYVNLFELSPRCPLYLGTHQFEEPKTCNGAGLSDRNTFMLEIANIYGHFGFELSGELPDYLPVMAEFLALTAGCSPADDSVRIRLIDKLMAPGARIVADKLAELEVPHRHLVEALVICLESELPLPGEADGQLDLVNAAATGKPPRLIQIEEVPNHG